MLCGLDPTPMSCRSTSISNVGGTWGHSWGRLRFGFNGGSALTVDGASVIAAVNSEIAASVALCGWIIIEWLHHGKPRLVGLCVGAIAGLATVTPAAGFIQPWAAFALGAIASVVCYLCCELRIGPSTTSRKRGLGSALLGLLQEMANDDSRQERVILPSAFHKRCSWKIICAESEMLVVP